MVNGNPDTLNLGRCLATNIESIYKDLSPQPEFCVLILCKQKLLDLAILRQRDMLLQH
jgi:hypothetical protein